MPNALTIKAMTYFTAALRHGNIAKAAEELRIAASAVATAIDQVEDAFGLTLVTRQRSKGIAATSSGLAVEAKCEHVLDEYRAMMQDGADLRGALTGVVRLGYYAPIAPAFLPDILRRALPEAGGVELHLEECDNDAAQDGLLSGAYDLILFVSEGARPSIQFDALVQAPPYCLLPKAHPLAGRAALRLSDIAAEPLVVLNRPVAAAFYQGLFKAHDITVGAYANSTEMVRSLVGAGAGCAILNMIPMTGVSYGGREVVGVPIADALPRLTLSIAYDHARPRRVVQRLAEACRAHFAEDGPGRCIVAARA